MQKCLMNSSQRSQAAKERSHWLIFPLNPKAPSSDQEHNTATGTQHTYEVSYFLDGTLIFL